MKKVFKKLLFALIIFISSAEFLFSGTSPNLEVLGPKKGHEVPYGSDVVIAISIYDPEADTDTKSIVLKVDGVDVTEKANISALLVTYTYKGIKAAGRHNIYFYIEDREGNSSEVTNFFYVAKEVEEERPYTVNGSISIGGEYDKERDKSFIADLDLNLYGSLFNTIGYMASLDLTNEEASDKQRLSSYRLDLYSPWGGMVLGDTTPSFSSYTIDGMRVFGVHLMPQVGIFGMELVYGKSLNAVEDPATYRQMVYGGKIKIGDEDKIQWGLSFVKVKDDKDSINTLDANPQDNIVLGTDFKVAFFNGLVKLNGEANESMLNTDITEGAKDFTDLELPINPGDWEWLFTINEHIVPLMPGLADLGARFGLMLGPIYNNTFNMEYSYIGPSFYSLANTAITNDRAGIMAWDTLWLLNYKLYINLAFQYYKNNLRDTLENTTKTIGYSTNVYIYPTDYLTINTGADILTAVDGSAVDTVNTTLNGGVAYDFELWVTSSKAYLNTTALFLKDNIIPSSNTNDYSNHFGLISYFDNFPMDTEVVLGYDFGDSGNNIYMEGKCGYKFLKDESLYAYGDIIYKTQNKELDITAGSTLATVMDTTVDVSVEYIKNPSSSDIVISVEASKEF